MALRHLPYPLTAIPEPLYCHCPQTHTAGKGVWRIQMTKGASKFVPSPYLSFWTLLHGLVFQILLLLWLLLLAANVYCVLAPCLCFTCIISLHYYEVGTVSIIPILLGGPGYTQLVTEPEHKAGLCYCHSNKVLKKIFLISINFDESHS